MFGVVPKAHIEPAHGTLSSFSKVSFLEVSVVSTRQAEASLVSPMIGWYLELTACWSASRGELAKSSLDHIMRKVGVLDSLHQGSQCFSLPGSLPLAH